MRIAACSTEMPSPPRWIADGAGRRVAPRTPAGALFTRRAEGDPVSTDLLRPHDHAEAVALFRAEVIGALARRELSRGELAAEIRKLAKLRFRPPGRRATKAYGESTLQRWLYAYRRGGLAALKPGARSDRGRGRELTPEQRELLLDIRREHPGASVPLILRTLVLDGRLAKGAVSATTVARLYREAKLPRGVRQDGHTRLRWQADHPGALWHGDYGDTANMRTRGHFPVENGGSRIGITEALTGE
jgi:putative transposase